MTELEFININPTSEYTDNINIFYSSSVIPGTSYANLNIGQVSIAGMTIPFQYVSENLDLQQTILQATTVTFKYNDSPNPFVTATIIERVRMSSYFYVRFNPVVIPTPTTLGNQTPVQIIPDPNDPQYSYFKYYQNPSEIIFNPYISIKFANSDDNPILSNATVLRKSLFIQQSDRNNDPIQPTNLPQILLNRATPAEIQDSNYTVAGIVNARYDGSKLTSGSVPKNDPALSLIPIRASLHPSGSNFTKIKGINLSDRQLTAVYFSPQVTNPIAGSKVRYFSGNKSFPVASDLLYIEEGNRFVRLVNRDVYSIDEDKMHSTNILGSIIRIQS